VGLTVPLTGAADSLRWARQTLALAEDGVLGDSAVVACEDHLVTLWLASDPALTEQLAKRQLAPLDAVADLDSAYEDRLNEPDFRFATESVLRARRLLP
jgi:hypothetical protein